MKVFLSWSGARSNSIAQALRDWMPLVLHFVEPWLSQQEISAGDRWLVQVGQGLSESNFGIICLTPENLTAPWILFEAGAISKSFSLGAVCPYLYDVDFSELTGPLSQFQGKKADCASTKELLESINSKAPSPLSVERFNKLFDTFWPELESKLKNIPIADTVTQHTRSQEEILEEMVKAVRSIEARFRQGEAVIPFNEEASIKFVISSGGRVPTSLPPDEKIVIVGPPARLVKTVAARMGLSVEKYLKEWFFEDMETRVVFAKKDDLLEIENQYRGRTCKLILTDLPF